MPIQKDFKRLVRRRMQKTGESYTAARARLLDSRAGAKSPVRAPRRAIAPGRRFPEGPPPAEYAKITGTSDAAVRAATGCGWQKWVEALDDAGAYGWPHARIARHLHDGFDVPGWWSQMITVGYERIRGLREPGQRRGGAFQAGKSRTYPVPMARLFGAFEKPALRRRWLPGIALTVRRAVPGRSMRITWPDGTSVEAWFVVKAASKSTVQVQHGKLPDRESMRRAKDDWGERLDALGELLAASGRRSPARKALRKKK